MGKNIIKAEERNWNKENITDAQLKDYLEKIITYTDSQLKFYKNKGCWRRLYSNGCIGIAVIAFSISLLVPLMKGPDETFNIIGKKMTFYEVSYLSLAVASILLLFDRLFGFSAAWIRYMLAKMELQKVISEYHGKWVQLIQSMDFKDLDSTQKNQLITTLLTFDNSVRKIVLDETNAWRTLFSKQLNEFTKTVSSRFESSENELLKSREKAEEKIEEEKKQKTLRGILLINFQKDNKTGIEVKAFGLDESNNDYNETEELTNTKYSCSFSNLKFGRYKLEITSKNDKAEKTIEKIELIDKEDTKEVIVNIKD